MGACLTQRPELFGAVVCGVPLLDMLRYDRSLIGALWTPEYGTPANPEDFRWLYAYSPYHNVRAGVNLPPRPTSSPPWTTAVSMLSMPAR